METEIRAPYTLKLASTPQQQATLREFIQNAYRREFNAQIPHFLPILAGLYRADGILVAACGLNLARHDHLYLEQYLAQPVEALLNQQSGETVRRDSIVEVGNLATHAPGNGRLMFAALCRLLNDNAFDWVVFTGTAKLRNSFSHLGIALIELADADAGKIGPSAAEWGEYYRCHPKVMAGNLALGRQQLASNSLLLHLFGAMPALTAEQNQRIAS